MGGIILLQSVPLEKINRTVVYAFHMAMAILSGALSMVSVQLVPYFVTGFASHLILDCFNRKRVRILYPLPGGIALDFCKAGGFVTHCFSNWICGGDL